MATSQTCAVVGLDGHIVQVEVDISPGLPAFNIVGLPDPAVQEARERVRAALRNSGCEFPLRRITVNLAKKPVRPTTFPSPWASWWGPGNWNGTKAERFSLASSPLMEACATQPAFWPWCRWCATKVYSKAYVPAIDAAEAALVSGVEVYPVPTLAALISHFRGEAPIVPIVGNGLPPEHGLDIPEGMNLGNVKGQDHAKRALEVAAAGFHNVLLNGPPGSGKTMLARCLPSILPPMEAEEALEVTKIYSVTGALPSDSPLMRKRPFRSPHYTISNAGLVGGGRTVRPGEITLSHRGVLFLDELPEFSHTALESLRQPLEDKVVTISRVAGSVTYPASFMLVAAMNPCPCGYNTDPKKECSCSPSAVARYQKRVSGPLLDRIDVFVEVPPVEYEKLMEEEPAQNSNQTRRNVEQAREIQQGRFREQGFLCNSEMGPADVWKSCPLDESARALLQTATQRLNLSARAFHRILKVSRTIADLDGAKDIGVSHLAEALQYRSRGFAS